MSRVAEIQKRADAIAERFGVAIDIEARSMPEMMTTVYMLRHNDRPLMRHWRNALHTLAHLETIERTLAATIELTEG